jgi:hypothetical protein
MEGLGWMRSVPSLVGSILTNWFDWVVLKAAEFPARGNEAVGSSKMS